MEHKVDKSPERIEELQRAIEEIKREDREVWGNYQSEYRIVEDPLHGMYIELIPYNEES
ncbi:hypothetical protein [Staphylococcus sp. LCT-H4]|uniref:hypothetical protein n=1 Tax=Staphylococcus sp. LCT-H4 TaxID=1914308 RepID=UPI0015A55BB4|nr:hypothetical protein [Staphylococcus sp. LCT-H4]